MEISRSNSLIEVKRRAHIRLPSLDATILMKEQVGRQQDNQISNDAQNSEQKKASSESCNIIDIVSSQHQFDINATTTTINESNLWKFKSNNQTNLLTREDEQIKYFSKKRSQDTRFVHYLMLIVCYYCLANQKQGLILQTIAQCPWTRDAAELHSDCICDFNPSLTTNLDEQHPVNRMSVQCSPVNFQQLLKALKQTASIELPAQLLYTQKLTNQSSSSTFSASSLSSNRFKPEILASGLQLASQAKLDLLHVSNSSVNQLVDNTFIVSLNNTYSNVTASATSQSTIATTVSLTDQDDNKAVRVTRHLVVAVQSLHLSRCGIQQIHPYAFNGLEWSLVSLSLSDNLLEFVPTMAIQRLINLKVLDLSNNRLLNIQANAFATLNKLNTLRLADNPIGRHQSSGGGGAAAAAAAKYQQYKTPSLAIANDKYFNSNNSSSGSGHQQIIDLMAFVGLENSLTDLNLKGTQLDAFPKAIKSLRNLAFLNLAQNQVSQIPPRSFEYMNSLTAINFERNRISRVDNETFLGVENLLSSLSLLGNLLEIFPVQQLSKLNALRRLDMGFNGIETIPDNAFESNKRLILIALDGNPIETLPEAAFKPLEGTLRGMSIGGKDLNCDCRLSWLLRWQLEYNVQISSRERQPQFCSKPHYLRSLVSFSALKPEHLTCLNDDLIDNEKNNSQTINNNLSSIQLSLQKFQGSNYITTPLISSSSIGYGRAHNSTFLDTVAENQYRHNQQATAYFTLPVQFNHDQYTRPPGEQMTITRAVTQGGGFKEQEAGLRSNPSAQTIRSPFLLMDGEANKATPSLLTTNNSTTAQTTTISSLNLPDELNSLGYNSNAFTEISTDLTEASTNDEPSLLRAQEADLFVSLPPDSIVATHGTLDDSSTITSSSQSNVPLVDISSTRDNNLHRETFGQRFSTTVTTSNSNNSIETVTGSNLVGAQQIGMQNAGNNDIVSSLPEDELLVTDPGKKINRHGFLSSQQRSNRAQLEEILRSSASITTRNNNNNNNNNNNTREFHRNFTSNGSSNGANAATAASLRRPTNRTESNETPGTRIKPIQSVFGTRGSTNNQDIMSHRSRDSSAENSRRLVNNLTHRIQQQQQQQQITSSHSNAAAASMQVVPAVPTVLNVYKAAPSHQVTLQSLPPTSRPPSQQQQSRRHPLPSESPMIASLLKGARFVDDPLSPMMNVASTTSATTTTTTTNNQQRSKSQAVNREQAGAIGGSTTSSSSKAPDSSQAGTQMIINQTLGNKQQQKQHQSSEAQLIDSDIERYAIAASNVQTRVASSPSLQVATPPQATTVLLLATTTRAPQQLANQILKNKPTSASSEAVELYWLPTTSTVSSELVSGATTPTSTTERPAPPTMNPIIQRATYANNTRMSVSTMYRLATAKSTNVTGVPERQTPASVQATNVHLEAKAEQETQKMIRNPTLAPLINDVTSSQSNGSSSRANKQTSELPINRQSYTSETTTRHLLDQATPSTSGLTLLSSSSSSSPPPPSPSSQSNTDSSSIISVAKLSANRTHLLRSPSLSMTRMSNTAQTVPQTTSTTTTTNALTTNNQEASQSSPNTTTRMVATVRFIEGSTLPITHTRSFITSPPNAPSSQLSAIIGTAEAPSAAADMKGSINSSSSIGGDKTTRTNFQLDLASTPPMSSTVLETLGLTQPPSVAAGAASDDEQTILIRQQQQQHHHQRSQTLQPPSSSPSSSLTSAQIAVGDRSQWRKGVAVVQPVASTSGGGGGGGDLFGGSLQHQHHGKIAAEQQHEAKLIVANTRRTPELIAQSTDPALGEWVGRTNSSSSTTHISSSSSSSIKTPTTMPTGVNNWPPDNNLITRDPHLHTHLTTTSLVGGGTVHESPTTRPRPGGDESWPKSGLIGTSTASTMDSLSRLMSSQFGLKLPPDLDQLALILAGLLCLFILILALTIVCVCYSSWSRRKRQQNKEARALASHLSSFSSTDGVAGGIINSDSQQIAPTVTTSTKSLLRSSLHNSGKSSSETGSGINRIIRFICCCLSPSATVSSGGNKKFRHHERTGGVSRMHSLMMQTDDDNSSGSAGGSGGGGGPALLESNGKSMLLGNSNLAASGNHPDLLLESIRKASMRAARAGGANDDDKTRSNNKRRRRNSYDASLEGIIRPIDHEVASIRKHQRHVSDREYFLGVAANKSKGQQLGAASCVDLVATDEEWTRLADMDTLSSCDSDKSCSPGANKNNRYNISDAHRAYLASSKPAHQVNASMFVSTMGNHKSGNHQQQIHLPKSGLLKTIDTQQTTQQLDHFDRISRMSSDKSTTDDSRAPLSATSGARRNEFKSGRAVAVAAAASQSTWRRNTTKSFGTPIARSRSIVGRSGLQQAAQQQQQQQQQQPSLGREERSGNTLDDYLNSELVPMSAEEQWPEPYVDPNDELLIQPQQQQQQSVMPLNYKQLAPVDIQRQQFTHFPKRLGTEFLPQNHQRSQNHLCDALNNSSSIRAQLNTNATSQRRSQLIGQQHHHYQQQQQQQSRWPNYASQRAYDDAYLANWHTMSRNKRFSDEHQFATDNHEAFETEADTENNINIPSTLIRYRSIPSLSGLSSSQQQLAQQQQQHHNQQHHHHNNYQNHQLFLGNQIGGATNWLRWTPTSFVSQQGLSGAGSEHQQNINSSTAAFSKQQQSSVSTTRGWHRDNHVEAVYVSNQQPR